MKSVRLTLVFAAFVAMWLDSAAPDRAKSPSDATVFIRLIRLEAVAPDRNSAFARALLAAWTKISPPVPRP